MILGVAFTHKGWQDYRSWSDNKAMLRKIDRLIEETRRDPGGRGIGKPERLSATLSGWSSRRINEEHRLIYRVRADDIQIAQCRGHYADK